MAKLSFVILLLLFVSATVFAVEYNPVVIMHGIGASSSSMDDVVSWIQEALPGVYVKNVEIGDGHHDSVFMNMNDQVKSFCDQLAADTNLTGKKINLIGYSQGGLITRGFIERCGVPQVHNYITWSSALEGVFGVPYANI
eukprot:EC722620.1.p1 GENE.EC722620.1~~EC722620.1.p1  ORF type:complete len:140 (+),score=12.15 EC722620.1:115-534(+)